MIRRLMLLVTIVTLILCWMTYTGKGSYLENTLTGIVVDKIHVGAYRHVNGNKGVLVYFYLFDNIHTYGVTAWDEIAICWIPYLIKGSEITVTTETTENKSKGKVYSDEKIVKCKGE